MTEAEVSGHEMLTLEMEGEHEPRTLTDSRGRKRQGTIPP